MRLARFARVFFATHVLACFALGAMATVLIVSPKPQLVYALLAAAFFLQAAGTSFALVLWGARSTSDGLKQGAGIP